MHRSYERKGARDRRIRFRVQRAGEPSLRDKNGQFLRCLLPDSWVGSKDTGSVLLLSYEVNVNS